MRAFSLKRGSLALAFGCCALLTLGAGCELRSPLRLTILELETQPCLLPPALDEARSCGAGLRSRVSGGRLPACLALRQGNDTQSVPLLADRDSLVFSPAESAPRLSLSGAGDELELKLFYLGAVADPAGICTPDRFSVDRACAEEEACILATETVRVPVKEGEYNRIQWGPQGLACRFDCHDPALCGSGAGQALELCDGQDNDCDGAVDEGPVMPGLDQEACSSIGVCSNTTGSCEDASWRCLPPPEYDEVEQRCDGLDNDCDGETDEDDAGGGAPCETGTPGRCSPGIQHCVQGELLCVADHGPGAETCDGSDEDCDGSIDEAIEGGALTQTCYSGPSLSLDVGQCRAGQTSCQEGRWGEECVGEILPQAELEDGLDNDCSGQTDNGFYDLLFDGVEEHAVGIPPHEALDLSERAFSVEAWLKPSVLGRSSDRVILARRNPETGLGFSFSIHYPGLRDPDGYLRFSVYAASGVQHFFANEHPVQANRWQQLVAAWSPHPGSRSSSLWLLLDGVTSYFNLELPVEAIPAAQAPLLIGADNRQLQEDVSGAPFLGSIAGVQLREGSEGVDPEREGCQQIGAPCTTAPTLFAPCAQIDAQTIAYWPLRQGAGDEATDLGPHALHGDIGAKQGDGPEERWSVRQEDDPVSECLSTWPAPPEAP